MSVFPDNRLILNGNINMATINDHN